MSPVDFVILFGIIAFLLLVGLTGRRKSRTTDEYFLAGRGLRWWQIGFSLFSTNFSAAAIIGLTGAAYLTGIAIYNYEWIGIIAIIAFALFLAPALRRSHVFTISQYLQERFDRRIKVIYSVFVIVMIIFIDMASALYAGGMLLKIVFPFLSLHAIIMIIMVLVGIYSIVGGLSAIARTDIFQTVVVVSGALLVTVFTFSSAGGWEQLTSNAEPEALSLVRAGDDRAVPWYGLLTGIPILCAYFWLANQNMVQWVLSAKTEQDAQQGLLLAGFMKLSVLLIFIIPGVAAVSLFPGLTHADSIYPTLLFELLPQGILGLVLAGFVAAIMASVDSTLHAATTIITMDFIKTGRRQLSHRQLVWFGRVIAMTIIAVSAIWAPMIGNFGTLFEYVQGILSYAVAPFVVVYLAGWCWKRANETGAFLSIMSGIATAALIAVGQQAGLLSVHYLFVPLPVALVSLIFMIGGSIAWPAPGRPERLLLRLKSPSLSGVSLTAAILLLITAVQVGLFW